jgi:hypothetical protein
VAARANGLRPVDGPFGDFMDPDGFKAAARRAAVLGCEGKWAIHPSQIKLANEVMSPSEADVLRANRIIAAMAQAAAEGKGAVSLDGRLIDQHRLEPSFKRLIFLDVFSVFVNRRRANTMQLTARQHRLEHVRGRDRAFATARAKPVGAIFRADRQAG